MIKSSQLVKDHHDIFSTRKVACFLENDTLHIMAVKSPVKSILSRIFHAKTRLRPDMVKERAMVKGDRCLTARSPEMFDLFNSDIFLGRNLYIIESISLIAYFITPTLFSSWSRGIDQLATFIFVYV